MNTRASTVFVFVACITVMASLMSREVRSIASTAVQAGPTAAPGSAENVEFVGHLGGETFAVFVQECYAHSGVGARHNLSPPPQDCRYAYIGVGPRLTILDISDLTSPTVLGQTAPLPGVVRDIYVSGGYAYVATNEAGLRVIDVTDLSAPVQAGFYDTAGPARGVELEGNYAYVAAGPRGGLRIVDVSNPLALTEVGFYDTPDYALDVAVAGDYAYIADDFSGLRVVSLAQPAAPVEVGFCDVPGAAIGVAVVGDYAYVAAGSGGLRIVDVSNPVAPTEVGAYETTSGAIGVTVAAGYAYVAAGPQGGLQVVDVSNPVAPTQVGFYDTPVFARDVVVVAGYAYVADGSGGLRIVDVSNLAMPVEVGFYETLGITYGIAVAESYTYAADGHNGLRVVDVSDPTIPTVIGAYNTPGHAYDVAIAGSYVYIADAYSGLWVVDISKPIRPKEVGHYNTPGIAVGIAVAGHYAYVADREGGLRIVDISNPANPQEVGFYDSPGRAEAVVVVGDYAYVAAFDQGLRVVDISTASNPIEVGSYDSPSYVMDVAVRGRFAYVASSQRGLRVVDVSNPKTPTEVGFYDTARYTYDVAVAGDYAYLADYDDGLRIVDVSDPTTPVETGFYDTPGYAEDVVVVEDQVFLADFDGGFLILRDVGTELPDQDHYEPDDTCAQASAITTDGTVQQRTFFDHADEDWAHFTATSGITYVVQAISTNPSANLILELYDACDGNLIGFDDDAFDSDARIAFRALAGRTYYVKASNDNPAVYGSRVTYELSVHTRSLAPVVVIVAGRNARNQLVSNITSMGDQAYRIFRRAGVSRENIRYLSAGANRDADQDGHLDVDGLPTWENVRYAVRDWPVARGLEPGRSFYLYLVGHGGIDYYCAMGCRRGLRVRAEDLDRWLSDLENNTGVDKVNVIIEACYSGSFIDVTFLGPAEISSPGRVVITSTGSRRCTFPSKQGGYFSDAFFTALGDNADLWTAYIAGRMATQAAWSEQTPWLDDNGDAVADGDDGAIARRRGLTSPSGGAAPIVDWLKVGEINASGMATVGNLSQPREATVGE